MLKQTRIFLLVAATAAAAGVGVQAAAPTPLSAQYDQIIGDDGGGEFAANGDLYEKTGPETKYVCICATTPDCEPCYKISAQ